MLVEYIICIALGKIEDLESRERSACLATRVCVPCISSFFYSGMP